MTREEFSQKLIDIRVAAGVNKSDMCRLTRISQTTLNSIEFSKQNYGILYAVLYANSLNTGILLQSDTNSYPIDSLEDFSDWFNKEKSKHNISLIQLASKVGSTQPTLSGIAHNSRKPKIDILLKLADYFGYTIKLQPITK